MLVDSLSQLAQNLLGVGGRGTSFFNLAQFLGLQSRYEAALLYATVQTSIGLYRKIPSLVGVLLFLPNRTRQPKYRRRLPGAPLGILSADFEMNADAPAAGACHLQVFVFGRESYTTFCIEQL